MMNIGENLDSIPMDLIFEIFSRLPAKSVARFLCVSKPWKSIICRKDFIELFRTFSSSNPRLLILVKHGREWSVFSSPQPQNHCGKSSLVVAADFHNKFSEDRRGAFFSYASGLFYFRNMRISKTYEGSVICNPITRQYGILPPDDVKRMFTYPDGLLGFDPIGKQFKVLVYKDRGYDRSVYGILTLGTENVRWREIECPVTDIFSRGICINGVLYCIAAYKICSFDVRAEKFKILNVNNDVWKNFRYLINYKGKLCFSDLKYDYYCRFPLKLSLLVLEDFEKGEWSTYAYTLSAANNVFKRPYVVGATASGEIVLANRNANKPFYVFYFNPEKNTLLCVEIQGVRVEEELSPYRRVHCFVDHVEDFNFDVMKTAYVAIREYRQARKVARQERLEQNRRTFKSVNKFDALCLSEDD